MRLINVAMFTSAVVIILAQGWLTDFRKWVGDRVSDPGNRTSEGGSGAASGF